MHTSSEGKTVIVANAPFRLEKIDQHSAASQKLARYYEDRLARLRAKNDGDLPAEKTAIVRGQIKEAKYLLSLLTKEATEVDADEASD